MATQEDQIPDVPMDDNTDLMDYARQVGVEDTKANEGGEPAVQPPSQPPEPAVPEPPAFTHPHLQGKSPEEIEAYLRLVENTVQSQNTRLNEMSAESARAAEPAMQSPEFDKDDFFDRPVEVIREVVRAEMAQSVGPINEEINNMRAIGQVNSAWQTVAAKFDDFETYRPSIETMLQGQGVRPEQVTAQLIESLYYGAYGYYQKAGPVQGAQPAPRPGPPGGPSIPQHRPSSAPLPRQAETVRQLTEEERSLARAWNMSEDDYRAGQDADIEDVVGGENE